VRITYCTLRLEIWDLLQDDSRARLSLVDTGPKKSVQVIEKQTVSMADLFALQNAKTSQFGCIKQLRFTLAWFAPVISYLTQLSLRAFLFFDLFTTPQLVTFAMFYVRMTRSQCYFRTSRAHQRDIHRLWNYAALSKNCKNDLIKKWTTKMIFFASKRRTWILEGLCRSRQFERFSRPLAGFSRGTLVYLKVGIFPYFISLRLLDDTLCIFIIIYQP